MGRYTSSSAIIAQLQEFTQHRINRERNRYVCYQDPLTGLPNRQSFTEKLKLSLKRHPLSMWAVFLIGVSRFKTINGSLGYGAGDQYLRAVANRLRQAVPPNAFVARMGGDEFLLLLPISREDEGNALCEHLHSAFEQPFLFQHFLRRMSIRIGVALSPRDGEDAATLLKHAAIALEQANEQSLPYHFYDPDKTRHTVERLLLETDLLHAIENQELHLVYQPRIDSQTGAILSVEALLRWHHPIRGVIPPASFVPYCEESGLILPIGEWVIQTACRNVRQWTDRGLPPIGVSVNLSAKQFQQPSLAERIAAILQETGLPPSRLELEITESTAMLAANAIDTLRALKELGVLLSIDDFGTGYSSMTYLKEFPIDRVKIDRSFVQNLPADQRDAAIVSMIVSISRHLQLQAVAEGVETAEQLAFLQSNECHHAQGFLFSKPLPADVFLDQYETIQTRARKQVTGETERPE